jgi:hypothetical protein
MKSRRHYKLASFGLIIIIILTSMPSFVAAESEDEIDTIFIYGTEDSAVSSWYPNENYGNRGNLELGYGGKIFFLKFNLSHIPQNVNILDVDLYLYKSPYAPHRYYPNIANCWSVLNDSWNENTITWNNKPEINEFLDQKSLYPYYPARWFGWNVTEYVKSEYNNDTFITFCFTLTNGYYSMLRSTETQLQPRLGIKISVIPKPTIKISPSDDSYVIIDPRSYYGYRMNFGDSGVIFASGGYCNIYIKFDLTNVSEQGMIQSAVLNLYRYIGPNRGNAIDIYSLLDDRWEEETITGFNRPIESDYITSFALPVEDTWWEIDITSFVRSEFIDDKVVSLVITNTGGGGMGIKSKDNGWLPGPDFNLRDGGFLPYLEITMSIDAYIDIDPNMINLKSKGKWITCYIELPPGYDVRDIDASTILLEDTITPVLDEKYGFVKSEESYIMDHDGDGIMERMVKFDRGEVENLLYRGDYNLKVSGELTDGTMFIGYSDDIRVQ